MSADGALKMFTIIDMCILTLRTENSVSLHLVASHLIRHFPRTLMWMITSGENKQLCISCLISSTKMVIKRLCSQICPVRLSLSKHEHATFYSQSSRYISSCCV